MFIIFAFLQSDLILKEVKVKDNIKVNFLDIVTERPLKISFYELPDSFSNKIIIAYYYKDYVNFKVIDYGEFQRRINLPPLSHRIYENKRVEYLIGQTLLGVGFYSWSFPLFVFRNEITDDNISRIKAGTGFIFPLFYFGANFLLTNGKNISSSQAYASFAGGIAGATHGVLLFNDIKWLFPFSISENFLDNYLCWAGMISPGMYQRKINHNIYGYYHYSIIKLLLKNEFKITKSDNTFSSILSIIEGYSILYLSRNKYNVSFGDALFELRTTAIGSEFIPAFLRSYYLFKNDTIQERTYAATSLIGHLAGYYIGNKLSIENDISTTTAFLSYLIPSLAHLFTFGITAIVNSTDIMKAYPIIFISTDVGLTYLVYNSFKDLGKDTGANYLNNFKFGFNLKPELNNNEFKLKPYLQMNINF